MSDEFYMFHKMMNLYSSLGKFFKLSINPSSVLCVNAAFAEQSVVFANNTIDQLMN